MTVSQEQTAHQKVDDPGEYNQRNRLQEIAEARNTARARLQVPDPEIKDVPHEVQAFRSVKALAADLEWVARENGSDEYFEQELGPVMVSPPSLDQFRQVHGANRFWGETRLKPHKMSVKGLYPSESGGGFINAPEYIQHTWTLKADTKHGGPEEVSITRGRYVPLDLSMRANRQCRMFIHEAGLDARVESQVDEDPNPI